MASPAIPGLFLCSIAMVLLILVSVSSPIWEKISFLDVTTGAETTHFGVFGLTGSSKSVGYKFDPEILKLPSNKFDNAVIHGLTFALVLHPIAAAVSALAVLFGLCGGAAYSRIGTIFMTLVTFLAALITAIAFIIDMIVWGIARARIHAAGAGITTADLGNANWLTLGALFALILAFIAGTFGSCARFRKPRERS